MRAPAARLSPAPHPARARGRRGALLAFAASLLVAGCGQRGPLYLPENAPPQRRSRSTPEQQQQPQPARPPAQQQQQPSQAQQQPQSAPEDPQR